MAPALSPVGAIVRRHDPDRFFTTLFAPAAQRETLWTLYAFNHELARAREAAREPFAALIRLQWWREVVEGARRRHDVAGPLGNALDDGRLLASDLAGMVDAREAETDAVPDLAAFEAYVLGAAGGVMVAAGRVLGAADPEALRPAGAAYGLAGVLRNVTASSRQGRCLLPEDVLSEAGLTPGQVVADPHMAERVVGRLKRLGLGWLEPMPSVHRAAISAVLPIVWARLDLRRPTNIRARSTRDKLLVVAAALTGRI